MPLNYIPLVRLLQHAALKLQYPSITVRTEGGSKLKIKLASKGYLAITLNGDYVGKISQEGELSLYSAKELISTMLSELNEDPHAYTKAQGLKYGTCCFCARELTDPASVEAGYGPICADTFGLPWGTDSMSKEAVDNALSADSIATDFMSNLSATAPLGEAERLLRDIDNQGIDLRIEGVTSAIEVIEALAELGVTDPAVFVASLKNLIIDMEELKS